MSQSHDQATQSTDQSQIQTQTTKSPPSTRIRDALAGEELRSAFDNEIQASDSSVSPKGSTDIFRDGLAAAFAEVDAMQYLKGRSTFINPVSFIRKRFIADLYRGLALHEEGNQEEANKLFRSSFEILNGDGILADDYFPLLRGAGLIEEHDRNFRIVYERLAKSIEAYPKAHNTYNSAAWMASRACRG